ncbi:type II secretion system protein GspK [Pseudomonas sp. T1.Ur]|uniref:type II secretion system protein GspK n=1 Tax=Pseudomonas sp. T1.Ur TaxID=2928704 RepID=UPI00201E6480|nr:type II secretion system protein GspK [Pseudomonas sp. T1.Ur]MCL6704241.1 type II secretion system protein GspK [Pseudomonas sp. T1.Ur]
MNRERGVALISVLLVLSLALLFTGGMLRSHRLLLHGTAQQLQQLPLRQLGLAGEAWAQKRLDSSASAPGPVGLHQDWARLESAFEAQDARIRIDIQDQSGRMNLNALLEHGQVDEVSLKRWKRLLSLLGLPELSLPQVGSVQELSQLRLLPGIDGPTLERLEPWVALLPREARLNVNTAPRLLLMTLDGIDAGTVEALAGQRLEAPFPSAQAFANDPLLSGLGISSHGLGVGSRWFRITVDVDRAGSRLRLASDIERDPDTQRWMVRQRRFLPISSPSEPL